VVFEIFSGLMSSRVPHLPTDLRAGQFGADRRAGKDFSADLEIAIDCFGHFGFLL
jgi:hypothetical protein